jgi:hypothetical protein
MRTTIKKTIEPRKSGEQVVEEKLKAANEFLKNANLSIIYKSKSNK